MFRGWHIEVLVGMKKGSESWAYSWLGYNLPKLNGEVSLIANDDMYIGEYFVELW